MKPTYILLSLSILMVWVITTGCKPTINETLPRNDHTAFTDCKLQHAVKGRHSAIVIQKCAMTKKLPRVTTVTVAIFNPQVKADPAAAEVINMLIKHFGYLPKLVLVAAGKAGKVLVYLFIAKTTTSNPRQINTTPYGL